MKVFVHDLDKCNGCHNCQIACKDEHVDNDWTPYAKPQPDLGQLWCRVDEEVCGQVPHVRVNYLSQHCNHCDTAPCMAACTAGAIEKRADGLVVLLPEKCTGSGACVDACPYEAIFFNEELGISQKCTGCAHLLDDNWAEPRCVDACCTGALRFGEEAEFVEELKQAKVLGPEHNTSPRVYYLNLPGRFIAATVVDIEIDEVVEGATITLQRISDEQQVAQAHTDEFGDIWFERLAPDAYRMWVQKEGYLDLYQDFDVTQKDQTIAELQFFQAPAS